MHGTHTLRRWPFFASSSVEQNLIIPLHRPIFSMGGRAWIRQVKVTGYALRIPKLRQSSHFPPSLAACSKPWTSAPLA